MAIQSGFKANQKYTDIFINLLQIVGETQFVQVPYEQADQLV